MRDVEEAVQDRLVGVDAAVAEVADEQIATEAAEACWGLCESPWCVQRAADCDLAGEQAGGCVEGVDVAQAGPVGFVAATRLCLRVGDEDSAADRLDPEWAVTARNRRVEELEGPPDRLPVAIEDVDAAVVEVGCVQPGPVRCLSDRETLEDRTLGCRVDFDLGGCPKRAVPGADQSGLAVEEKQRRARVPTFDRKAGLPLKTTPVGASPTVTVRPSFAPAPV